MSQEKLPWLLQKIAEYHENVVDELGKKRKDIVKVRDRVVKLESEVKQLRAVHEAELGVCEKHCDSVLDLKDKLDRAGKALNRLIEQYIANPGSDREFICCITPRHGSAMTPKERKKCPHWSAWDEARAVAKELENTNNKSEER